ncbi:phage tail protein [Salmonella enterica]|nr:phage tail protein [Salmonella enterica]HBM0065514.1 tail fiber protein [Salmonella enterica subsp. enterica serovar Enteritidis]EBL7774862.1 phage tail protein [Salmonella enterica]EHB8452751.1 phage tail protein [Salmonella enterica]EHC7603671.1 phage tail protein [Salmonella enterica]
MSTKFKTVITTAGAAKLAAATMPGGKKINLNVMAVGDGGGKLPEPDAGQTQLVNEVWRHTLNKISQDNRYSNYIVAELVIPPEVGGFWMRELGLYDDEGTLIAVANMAESYKPELAEGSGRAQTCRMVIIVSSVESVALSIDSTMVMATQDYVDDRLAEHEKSRRHPDATLKEKGFTQLSNATDSESETLAATPKAVKTAYDLANAKYTAQDATTTRKGIVQLSNATDSVSETLAATPKAVKVAYDLANAKYTAQDATTARKGIIQLSNATDSTSETLAATPKAVKAAMDNANGRVPSGRKVNGHPLSGDITLWASDVKAISADAVGEITDNGTMASANAPGWWRVSVSNSDSVADFPTYPDGSKLYSYGYMFVEKIGEVWFQHYYAHMGANAKRQDWGTVPNTSRPWIIDYNTANKPSAGDVGALPITGGRLNGPLGIGTDNALGGNSIVFGDNDTGIKQNGDGVLDVYSNYTHVFRFIGNLVESMVSLKVNGNSVATGEVQAGNGSSRMTSNGDIFGSVWGNSWLSLWINNNFVADVQLGAGTSVSTWNNAGSWPNTPGYVVTSVWKDAQGENIDGIAYAPLQKRVGSQWYTVQGGTA